MTDGPPELAGAGAPPLPCAACHGEGKVIVGEHEVSMEMAIDAGDRSMAGSHHSYEYEDCDVCGGSGFAGAGAPPVPPLDLACQGCGGPCQFDTSIPSVQWNAVVRAKGLPEYLCLSCIVKAFALAGESFSATLSGERLNGIPLDIRINGADAKTIEKINDENNALRWRILELESAVSPAAPPPPWLKDVFQQLASISVNHGLNARCREMLSLSSIDADARRDAEAAEKAASACYMALLRIVAKEFPFYAAELRAIDEATDDDDLAAPRRLEGAPHDE